MTAIPDETEVRFMPIRLAVAIGVYLVTVVASWNDLKKSSNKERAIYVVAMAIAAYCAFLFATNKPWPNLDTVLHSVYAWPARAIVRMFKS